MANIAHARTFDGTDDTIQLANTGFLVAPGPATYAAIFKTTTQADGGGIISLMGGTGSEWAFEIRPSLVLALYDEVGGFQVSPITAMATGVWYLVAVTKADGTATPRFHFYRYDTQVWVHENASATMVDQGLPAGSPTLHIGSEGNVSNYTSGDIACAGVWLSAALSDAALEGMVGSIASWEAQSPTALWLLNQTVTTDPVNDRIGDADQTAIAGTTVTAISDLAFAIDEKQSFYASRRRSWR